MKVIIDGSRDFDDYELLTNTMEQLCESLEIKIPGSVYIVSGTAKGADKLGEKWAAYNGLKILLMSADWEKHGKAAGPIRNAEMADIADLCVLFWDGKSSGTRNMLENCLKKRSSSKSCEV